MTEPNTVVDRHQPDLFETATAELSECRQYRYALTRTWNPELPAVCWVMLNPSTADAFQLDNTVTRCVDFARRWGGGGVLVLNLFALRSTDPQLLYRHPDPVGPANDQVMARMVTSTPLLATVAAWGMHGVRIHPGRGAAVCALLAGCGVELQCLGTTKEGQPRHPLYVGAVTPLTPYEMPEEAR